jgi:hypothetical protein
MVHRIHTLEPELIVRRHHPRSVDKQHREEFQEVVARWVDATIPDPHNPLHHLQTANSVARQVEDLAEHELRRAALFALADGASLASIGRELGLSRWAIAKRWPDLTEQAEPYRWFPRNNVEWYKWVSELLKSAPQSADRDALDQLLEPYRRAIWNWWLLLDTPPLVRAVLSTWQPDPDDVLEQGTAKHLTELLDGYDATRPRAATAG